MNVSPIRSPFYTTSQQAPFAKAMPSSVAFSALLTSLFVRLPVANTPDRFESRYHNNAHGAAKSSPLHRSLLAEAVQNMGALVHINS